MVSNGDIKLVIIGGGTGLSTLLRGIKAYEKTKSRDETFIDLNSLTAIVTVTDDAGQTGKLIDEFGIIPPGDIRECMAALADEEGLITRLFLHKFEGEGTFGGLSFGNLLLTALVQINENNYIEAIKDASRVLRVKGNILPSTVEHVRLCAKFEDGNIAAGEDELNQYGGKSPIADVWLGWRDGDRNEQPKTRPEAMTEAVDAILAADVVVLGPGGLYTSIIPNLLVDGIADAILRSSARVVYIANAMTQPGKTDGYSLSDHISTLKKFGGFPIDYVLANNTPLSEHITELYSEEGAEEVIFDPDSSSDVSRVDFGDGDEVLVVEGSILCMRDITKEEDMQYISLSRDKVKRKPVLRHDPDKLARSLIDLLEQAE